MLACSAPARVFPACANACAVYCLGLTRPIAVSFPSLFLFVVQKGKECTSISTNNRTLSYSPKFLGLVTQS